MSDLRLVVFDMDGTLIDSQYVIIEAMRRAFMKLNLPAPRDEQTRSIIGLSLDEAISTIAPELSPGKLVEGVEAYKQSFVELRAEDRKSTRLNSSHVVISYAVFCLKKKKKEK